MTLDVFQMQQCDNQGKLFESLDRRDIDAKAFIKAFMNSRAAAGLDSTFDHFQWAGNEYIYEDVVEEFDLKPMTNPPRYNTEALYWGGYITRYWHYLTGETMKQIYAQCDETRLLQCYGFHSEANEMAIADIKAIAGQSKGEKGKIFPTSLRKQKGHYMKMVKVGVGLTAAVLLWSGCVSAEFPVPAERPVRTGVYAGRGISGNGAVEWFRIVQSSPELELKVLDSEMIRNGGLDGLDLLVMPGGSSPGIKRDLGTNGTARLREFIRNGGGYVGTCAGCCLMMEEAPDPSRGIGVMPFYRSGSKGRYLIPIGLNEKGAKALGINKGTYIVQYSHGPILEPSTQLVENASFEVWGTFRTDAGKYGNQPEMYGRAAIVGGTYGKGRVFAISCHPEFFENSRLIVTGAFRYVTGRDITLPVRPRRRGALTVGAYSSYPIGVETAKTLLAIDGDEAMDLFPVNDEDIRRGLLDHCDVLLFPHADKGKLAKGPQTIVDRFVSRGGFILGWGGGTSRVPKEGKRCATAEEALSTLREYVTGKDMK